MSAWSRVLQKFFPASGSIDDLIGEEPDVVAGAGVPPIDEPSQAVRAQTVQSPRGTYVSGL